MAISSDGRASPSWEVIFEPQCARLPSQACVIPQKQLDDLQGEGRRIHLNP